MSVVKKIHERSDSAPNRDEAKEAVRTLIKWIGDNPDRAGLRDTPERVVAFYEEFFATKEKATAETACDEIKYEDMIMIRNINIMSFCEHHMLPFTGTAHIAYIPGEKVAGFGTLARIADECARSLTTQEAMGTAVAEALQNKLAPQGIALMIEASHGCMTLRGSEKRNSRAVTTLFTGIFQNEPVRKTEFLELLKTS